MIGVVAARASVSSFAQGERRLCGHAAPDGLDRAVGRLQLGERALHRPVLHGRRADLRQREHRGADGDPERRDEGARAVAPQPSQPVLDGHERALGARLARGVFVAISAASTGAMLAEDVTGVNLLVVCASGAAIALLSVLTTNQKGAIAEAAIVTSLRRARDRRLRAARR